MRAPRRWADSRRATGRCGAGANPRGASHTRDGAGRVGRGAGVRCEARRIRSGADLAAQPRGGVAAAVSGGTARTGGGISVNIRQTGELVRGPELTTVIPVKFLRRGGGRGTVVRSADSGGALEGVPRAAPAGRGHGGKRQRNRP